MRLSVSCFSLPRFLHVCLFLLLNWPRINVGMAMHLLEPLQILHSIIECPVLASHLWCLLLLLLLPLLRFILSRLLLLQSPMSCLLLLLLLSLPRLLLLLLLLLQSLMSCLLLLLLLLLPRFLLLLPSFFLSLLFCAFMIKLNHLGRLLSFAFYRSHSGSFIPLIVGQFLCGLCFHCYTQASKAAEEASSAANTAALASDQRLLHSLL